MAGNQMSRDLNEAMKSAAEPVRQDSESLARVAIKRSGIDWTSMRVGIAKHSVYVAPVRRRGSGSGRPNLKTKLLDEAMAPALVRNSDRVAREFQDAVKDMGRAWARVG